MTTQEDPLAMVGLTIIPLITLLSKDNVVQKWYADKANAVA